ncbi:adenylate/guanylate cyclase domain-containing protein [Leptospira sp. GIMC2001]|uniref:adenylate/guanylate cyclase domain-containing protein n=1 Tax=Leptospira sp. GIMC2001 TaxID=1513297 RepID=UPI00234986E9|nr:adenylate/guanylate cyclase domain-containing protein [Leptospira sp. GIMC2001]WCL49855.1 HAMP domain-containing protein [Leptospira sp. GIMC2001]
MIFLASYFFLDDSEKRVQENNLAIVDVIGQKVESELRSNSFTLISFANLQLQSSDTSLKRSYEQELFTNHPNFIYVGLLDQKDGKPFITKQFLNSKYAEENALAFDSFIQVNRSFESEYIKSFRGASTLFNASPGFVTPILGLSIPWKRSGKNYTILVYLDSIEFLKTFQGQGINTTYLVNEAGDLLAHPNTELVIAGKSFADQPIVKSLLESKIDNGQTKYKDEQGHVFLGSFKKLWDTGLGIISTVESDKAFEEVYNIQRRNIIFLLIIINLSIVIVFLFSRTISNPIRLLVEATKQVEQGNFQVDIEPSSGDEVGVLTNSFRSMAVGLEEREKVKSILGSMIDPVVVQEAMKDMEALKRGKEEEITAFFSDVASFSTISEQLSSVDLANLLNEYLSAMTIILKSHEGVLDKYIGDAIVAIYNAPVHVPDHAIKAARASLQMNKKLGELRQYWTKNNLYSKEAQEMDARIGLNTGPAKVGFMGTDDLASYTMMGDTVNLAARLEAAGKDYGVNILISENTNERVKNVMFTRHLDLVRVKGKNEPVRIYELIAEISDATSNQKSNGQLYEEGFKFYLSREWKKAIDKFQEADRARGTKDKSARMLIERCEYFLKEPPAESWDGVFTRTTK